MNCVEEVEIEIHNADNSGIVKTMWCRAPNAGEVRLEVYDRTGSNCQFLWMTRAETIKVVDALLNQLCLLREADEVA